MNKLNGRFFSGMFDWQRFSNFTCSKLLNPEKIQASFKFAGGAVWEIFFDILIMYSWLCLISRMQCGGWIGPAAVVATMSNLICYCSIATVACIWYIDPLAPHCLGSLAGTCPYNDSVWVGCLENPPAVPVVSLWAIWMDVPPPQSRTQVQASPNLDHSTWRCPYGPTSHHRCPKKWLLPFQTNHRIVGIPPMLLNLESWGYPMIFHDVPIFGYPHVN